MSRIGATVFLSGLVLAGCSHSEYAVRPIPRIAADTVGKPVRVLRDALGEPRKIDEASNRLVYVWFLPQTPDGAPVGLHGCELEVTVDPLSNHVLGYTLSNIGWTRCAQVERKVLIAPG